MGVREEGILRLELEVHRKVVHGESGEEGCLVQLRPGRKGLRVAVR